MVAAAVCRADLRGCCCVVLAVWLVLVDDAAVVCVCVVCRVPDAVRKRIPPWSLPESERMTLKEMRELGKGKGEMGK